MRPRPLEPLLNSKVLTDLVYERLVAAIADGTLPPGHRLRQDEVASLLGVSRQPVSHALQLVKRQGLAVEHGRKGLAVAPVDGPRVRGLYEVRAALDALAARLGATLARARRLDEAAKDAALLALETGEALGARDEAGAFIRADVAFHTALYRLSGNLALEETVTPQWPHFMRAMGAVLEDAGRREMIWGEHRAILGLVLAGDVEAAGEAARGHALRAGSDTAARIEARPTAA